MTARVRPRVLVAVVLAALCAALAPRVAAVVVVGRVYRPVVAAPFVGGLVGVAPTGAFYRPPVVVVGRKLQAAPPRAPAPPAGAGACKTVADVLQQTPSLSALNGLAGRLAESLKSELASQAGAAFTFFAPSDAAIRSLLAALPAGGKGLVGNETALTALLSYHVVPGDALTASELKNDKQLRSALRGAPPLRVRRADGGVLIVAVGSEAAVTQPDIRTCRGVVHVVDTVLLPLTGAEEAAQQRG